MTEHPLDPAVRNELERVMESEGVSKGEDVIRVMTQHLAYGDKPGYLGWPGCGDLPRP